MNQQISSLQKAEREIILNYSLTEVKAAIMLLFKKFPSRYLLRENDINEVLNIYHFAISKNLHAAIVDITLMEEGENKTKMNIIVTNAHGALSSNSILSGILHDYLLVLGKVLNKESFEDITQVVGNSGCLVILLVGFGLASLLCTLLI